MNTAQPAPECVFCKIVAGEAPAHWTWEDETHLTFLPSFPNTEGFSMVIPKAHRTSYVADLNPQHSSAPGRARNRPPAGRGLPRRVARTGIMYEGYGVDHAHAKFFPIHGIAGNAGQDWREVASPIEGYFDRYQGYLSSHDHQRVDDTRLADVAKRIREATP